MDDVAEGDFLILDQRRLFTGAGLGCHIDEIEEEPEHTFHLRLFCGGSNPHFVGTRRANVMLDLPNRMSFLFNGEHAQLPLIRRHR